jgi:hypothetical protein
MHQVRTICLARGRPHPPLATPLLLLPGQLPPPIMADATGPSRQFTAPAQEAARAGALLATAIGSPADALAPRPAMPASVGAASAEPVPEAAARVAYPAGPPVLVPAIRVALPAGSAAWSAVEARGAVSCASCASAAAIPSSGLHPRAVSPAMGEGAAHETASRPGHQADPSDGAASSTGQPAGVASSCGKPNGCVCSLSI